MGELAHLGQSMFDLVKEGMSQRRTLPALKSCGFPELSHRQSIKGKLLAHRT